MVMFVWKGENKRKRGRGRPFFKKMSAVALCVKERERIGKRGAD